MRWTLHVSRAGLLCALGAGVGVAASVAVALALAGATPARGAALPPSAAAPARIAYLAGSSVPDIRIANADGSGRRRLGVGVQPSIAPDGQLVAASRYEPKGAALEIYPATGGTPKGYFDVSKVGAVALSWSPDSRYLAVALISNSPASDRLQGLAIVDTVGGSASTIARGVVAGASFAPALPYRIAYGLYPATVPAGAADIYSSAPDGTGRRRLTHDRRSLHPVWGPMQIAFVHEQLRGRDSGPAYQLWLMEPDGTHRTQITHMRIPPLLEGLVPMAFSADGERLVASYQGQDTTGAFTVQIATRRVREIKVKGQSVSLGGISLDGSTVLIDFGGFANPPSAGTIESVPFGGGKPTVLIRHAGEPSWNR